MAKPNHWGGSIYTACMARSDDSKFWRQELLKKPKATLYGPAKALKSTIERGAWFDSGFIDSMIQTSRFSWNKSNHGQFLGIALSDATCFIEVL